MAKQNDISAQILNYLFKQPEASDTLEGITEWWLMSQKTRCEIKRVKAAVLELIKEGWLIEIKRKDSAVRYHLNPNKVRE